MTFYFSRSSAYFQIFCAAVVLVAAYVRLMSETTPINLLTISIIGFVATGLSAALAWPAFRTLILREPALELNDEGVVARTYLGSRRLGWAEIQTISLVEPKASRGMGPRAQVSSLRFAPAETSRLKPLIVGLHSLAQPWTEVLTELQKSDAYVSRASEALRAHSSKPLFGDDAFLAGSTWCTQLVPRLKRPLLIVAIVVLAQFLKTRIFKKPADLSNVLKTQVAPDLCHNERSMVRGCYTIDEAACRSSLEKVVDLCLPKLKEAQAHGIAAADENQFVTLCLQKSYLEMNIQRVLLTQQCAELQDFYAGHDLSWLLEVYKAQKHAPTD